MIRTSLLLTFAAVLVAQPALTSAWAAAPKPKVDQAPAVQAVVQCRAIIDSAQRLACFDAAAAKLDDAQARGDLVTIDRAQRQTLRKEAFGFALPSLSVFDKGEKADDVNTLTTKLVRATADGQGRLHIVLEGDQHWSQVDSTVLALDPKPGETAVVKKGLLGSYTMKIGGQPSIKVQRDR